jgi:hypothetical protein
MKEGCEGTFTCIGLNTSQNLKQEDDGILNPVIL